MLPKNVPPPPSVTLDRLPPYSREAEQGIIGCILLDPAACVEQCRTRLQSDGSEFYEIFLRSIYATIHGMWDRGEHVDLLTIRQRLNDLGVLKSQAEASLFSSLPDTVPSASNLTYYIDIVREKHLLRRVIQTCSDVIGDAMNAPSDVRQIVQKLSGACDRELSGKLDLPYRQVTVVEALTQSADRLEWRFKHQDKLSGVATGISDLDQMTDGLQPGELTIIGARPSQGKTSLVMNIAEHALVKEGIPVGVFTLEMRARSLVDRMVCGMARVDSMNYRRGKLTERDFHQITTAHAKLSKSPLYMIEGDLDFNTIRAITKKWVAEKGVKLVVVDYLQRIHSNSKHEKKTYEIGEVSKGLQAMAKDFGIPVVCAAQLNRESEKDKGRKPRPSDLGDSGQIERDADMIVLLWHDPTSYTVDYSSVELIVAKQRDGATGIVPAVFLKRFVRFENATRGSREAVVPG